MMTYRFPVLAAALAWSLCACGGKGGGSAAGGGPPPIAVDVAKAEVRTIATDVELDGQVTPMQESVLSLQQSGTVTAVDVNEGDRVSKGQLLAQIDDSTLQAQLAQASAEVTQARASLSGSSLTSPITAQQLSSATITAQQQLLTSQNALSSAQSAFDTAQRQYVSDKELAGQGYLASTSLDQQRSAYVAAEQQLASAKNSIALERAAVAAAKRNESQTAVQQTDVSSKQGALAAAEANVKLLQTEISQTTLYAPYDGVITQRLLDPGSYASPNQAILRISQIDHVYVNANVPDEDLGFVRAGTPVTFTSSNAPGHLYTGTIYAVNATPTSGTLSYRARIVEANPGDYLRGGMLVTVTVPKERHPNAIVVPRTAIFDGDQGSVVYTVAPGAGSASATAKALPVTLGLETDTLAEVRSAGVRPGTTVIVTRPDGLMNGSAVAVSAPPPQAAPSAAGAH